MSRRWQIFWRLKRDEVVECGTYMLAPVLVVAGTFVMAVGWAEYFANDIILPWRLGLIGRILSGVSAVGLLTWWVVWNWREAKRLAEEER